jgi:hypothetical protein
MKVTRRNHLTAMGSALLAASPLATAVNAADRRHGHDDDAEVLYGHGQVWNRDLPGIAGELKLAFDLRVNLETGVGFGAAHDPVHPDWNVHFSIESAERTRLRRGEQQFMLKGVVTHSNGGFNVGEPVRILAQTQGDTTALAIGIGDQVFGGAGLVVIAIIAILIGLLVPAIQKV